MRVIICAWGRPLPVPPKYWLVCKRCLDELGYVEDAPKFASERGLKRHLKEQHKGATKNVEREPFTL